MLGRFPANCRQRPYCQAPIHAQASTFGALANVAVSSMLEANGFVWWSAALIGVVLASVWNYALSSKFVWGRFQ